MKYPKRKMKIDSIQIRTYDKRLVEAILTIVWKKIVWKASRE